MSYTLECTSATPLETAMTVADVVEVSWLVVSVFAFVWAIKVIRGSF